AATRARDVVAARAVALFDQLVGSREREPRHPTRHTIRRATCSGLWKAWTVRCKIANVLSRSKKAVILCEPVAMVIHHVGSAARAQGCRLAEVPELDAAGR